jgi:uncharacterized membrane protein YkvA (DUF1232 family)
MLNRICVLINQTKQALSFVCHAWRDSRVPFIARIFLVLAPIYWLWPYDLIPDHLSGGYVDDLMIVPPLIVVGLILVPRIVFQDAKRAAAQAACGLICLSFPGTVPNQNVPALVQSAGTFVVHRQALSSAKTNQLALRAPGSFAPTKRVLSLSPREEVSSFAPGQAMAKNLDNPFGNKLVTTVLLCHQTGQLEPSFTHTLNSPATYRAESTFLIIRGGQYQLYASDDSSIVSAAELSCQTKMPLRFAGGIFVGYAAKYSPTERV